MPFVSVSGNSISSTATQLYGTLHVTIDRVVWFMRDPPAHVSARLAWWGDTQPATVFR